MRPGTLAHRPVEGAPSAPSEATTLRRGRTGAARWIGAACIAGVLLATAARYASYGCVLRCDPAVSAAEGAPALAGAPVGVFLWHDPTGWHLRARSEIAARELSGALRVTGGVLEDVRGIDDNSADSLSIDGRHAARFHFEDPGALSGFDFTAHTGCVELTVTSKDELTPELVHIGAIAKSPDSLPIRLCR